MSVPSLPARIGAAARTSALVCACTLGACATIANAPPLQFVDRSYIAPKTWTDSTISYEAYVAPPIFLYDNQSKNFISLTETGGPAALWGFRMAVTPTFIIRQLKDSSSAVRTPSFNPRVSVEAYHLAALHRTTPGGSPQFDWERLDGFRFTLAHHSDGQAGCFLEGQKPSKPGSFEADDCTPPPATGVLATNRANGDFSTTYASFLWHETLLKYAETNRTPLSLGVAVGYDWELPKGSHVPGVLPDIERQFYGTWRKHVQTDLMAAPELGCAKLGWTCWMRGRARATALYEWAPTDLGPLASRLEKPIPHFRSYFDFSYTLDVLHNTGVFLRRVDGQDYYNIGFVQRRQVTLLGVVLDLGGYEIAK